MITRAEIRNLRRPPRLDQRGQTLAEIGMVIPLLMLLAVGTLQVGFVLYQGHVVHKVVREGANMLSRQVTLQATADAIQNYGVPHLTSFNADARLVLSVVQLGNSGSNAGQNIITQRIVVGGLAGTSILGNPSAGAFGGSPDYRALDPANNTALRTGTLPNGLGTLGASDTVFVAELFVDRKDIASLRWPFNIPFDDTLYANAFF